MLNISESFAHSYISPQPRFPANFALPEAIGKKERRPTLASYAAHLRAYGATYEEIRAKVFEANEQRCHPPLVTDVELKGLDRLCHWASKKSTTDQKRELTEEEAQILANAEVVVENTLRPQLMPERRFKPPTVRKKPNRRISQSLYTVAKALLFLMRDLGRIRDVAADSRTLAEETGLSRRTVSRALVYLTAARSHDLIDEPLFSRVVDERIRVKTEGDLRTFIRHSYTYSLKPKKCKIDPHILSPLSQDETWVKIAPFSHDAFLSMSKVDDHGNYARVRGLPRSVLVVYETLPISTQQKSVEKTGLCLRTVKSAFRTLEEYGMIEKKAGLWIKTKKTLDELAAERRTIGAQEQRHRQFEEERKLFRENNVAELCLGMRKLKVVADSPDVDVYSDVPFPTDADGNAERDTIIDISTFVDAADAADDSSIEDAVDDASLPSFCPIFYGEPVYSLTNVS